MMNHTQPQSPPPKPQPQYILTVLINGYRRKVGKVYNEEELLAAIDTIPKEYQPEYEELHPPPMTDHYTRTVKPSWNSVREMEKEWRRVPLTRCQCGAVQVYENYRTGERKCMECGVVNPKVKRVFLPTEPKWKIVKGEE